MPEPEEDEDDGGPRAFWSGTISFGLVSIPVNLFAVTRPAGFHLRMLGPDGAPLRRVYVCPKHDGAPLEPDELVRGHELESGEVVVVTDEELEALEPEKSRDIDLRRFVPCEELDPLHFERPYVLGPAGESTKAYRLLAATMERTKRAGIATFVMRGKEHLVAITSEKGVLRAETLRFADEVRTPDDVGLPEPPEKADGALVKRFARAVEELCEERLPLDALKDERTARVEALAREKRGAGKEVIELEPAPAAEEGGDAVDLMALIQESLAGQGKGKGGDGPARPRRARTHREAAAKAKKRPRKKRAARS